jgi:hypothetical protein
MATRWLSARQLARLSIQQVRDVQHFGGLLRRGLALRPRKAAHLETERNVSSHVMLG